MSYEALYAEVQRLDSSRVQLESLFEILSPDELRGGGEEAVDERMELALAIQRLTDTAVRTAEEGGYEDVLLWLVREINRLFAEWQGLIVDGAVAAAGPVPDCWPPG
ncbi:hypothetical protein ACH4VR_29520 [Streptomyces sp. NPDC020883]|uniref:hypothetical protein n=1 Tax=Streptomyces sp. NPDC020883 TaxID=3365099 RepID=UPI0037B75784